MDLCGPMRVALVNGKNYIIVIVDDFSRFPVVYFLSFERRNPDIIKKFTAQAQLNYKAKVCKIQTDNGTEFKNVTLKAYYEKVRNLLILPSIPLHNRLTIKKTHLLHSLSLLTHKEALLVVTTSDEQTSLIFLQESDEFNQEDSADFDGNTQFVPYDSLNHEEIESSTTNLEPSNVQNYHQV
ncbi:retrovirus-related pol polyprotein from transposon TNT 1-94 [Tanacetum coccineum]